MMLPIRKIISGGQNGADQAGLIAARAVGLQTGGHAPKDFKTLDGPLPELKKFGLIEDKSPNYPPRTKKNVKNSDGTVRFAYNWSSYGEICTLKAINQYSKPHFDVDLNILDSNNVNAGADCFERFRNWLIENNIKILNVAGNSEKTHTGIFNEVKSFLFVALNGRVTKSLNGFFNKDE